MPYGPGSSKFWAMAVSQAKKMGYTRFRQTDAGHSVASKIAEEMAQEELRRNPRSKIRLKK